MADIVLPSASRTTDQTVGVSAIAHGNHARSVAFIIDITDLEAGTPSITVSIRFIDPASGKTFNILTSAALGAVASTVLRVTPYLNAVANLTAQDMVPEVLEVFVNHADAQPITYSIGLVHA